MNIKKLFAGILTAAVAASSMIIPSSAADSYTANIFISDSDWIGQYWAVGDTNNTLNDCVKNVTVKGDGQYTVSLDVSGGFTKEGSSYSNMKDLDILGVLIADAGSDWKDAKITIDKLTVDGSEVSVNGAESRVDETNALRIDLFNNAVTPNVTAINGSVGTFSELSITFTLSGTGAEEDSNNDSTTTTEEDGETTTTNSSAPTGVKDISGILIISALAITGAVVARKKKA